ncbi:hypothetical protein OAF96_01050 [bacterium]|nr:hypothetical protein [bacterium]
MSELKEIEIYVLDWEVFGRAGRIKNFEHESHADIAQASQTEWARHSNQSFDRIEHQNRQRPHDTVWIIPLVWIGLCQLSMINSVVFFCSLPIAPFYQPCCYRKTLGEDRNASRLGLGHFSQAIFRVDRPV